MCMRQSSMERAYSANELMGIDRRDGDDEDEHTSDVKLDAVMVIVLSVDG